MVTISGEVVFEVIIPILMANLIDYGIDAGNMPYVAKMGLILLLSAAGQLLCGVISGKFAAEASSGFARNLRHDMFYKVQTFSFSNIDKFFDGEHRHPPDDRRDEPAEYIPDDHPHGGAQPADDGLFSRRGVLDRRAAL